MPVTGLVDESTAAIRAAGHSVRGIRVDAVQTGEHDWPVIVIELTREEECTGKAVILCAVVAVVFVGGNGVTPKAVVGSFVSRQLVVMAENQRFAVLAHNQLWRNRSLECPH